MAVSQNFAKCVYLLLAKLAKSKAICIWIWLVFYLILGLALGLSQNGYTYTIDSLYSIAFRCLDLES